MSQEHFVVIGNGPAGNQAALTLKEKSPESRVTLISRHPESCYRPHLLPDYIAGKIQEEALYVCPISSYRDKGIKLRSGQRVVRLSLQRQELALDHKELVPYDGLIIAVGGRPRIPEPLQGLQDLMMRLKTVEDAKAWMANLPRADSVLLIGGDLTSLALTRALLRLKKRVYFLINDDALWPLRCTEELIRQVTHKLEEKGVKVLTRGRITSVARVSPQAYRVVIAGQQIEVGLVGAFFGLVPDIRFLARSGLNIDRGVLVDAYLNTGFEGVYATGDCAQIYHPELRDYWVSIGHDNACALGRIAASNLLGAKVQAVRNVRSIYDLQDVKVNTSWWTEF
jgi:nitrite reductase (NADH) large subunit